MKTVKPWSVHGRRGGLAALLGTLVLIVLVVVGLVAIALYYSSIATGTTSQPHVVFDDSIIKVNVGTGEGSVFIKLYNQGPGTLKIREIDVKGTANWFVAFDRTRQNPRTSDDAAVCTYNGSPGTGYTGADGSASMVLAGGATMSINCVFAGDPGHSITNYFEAPIGYGAILVPRDSAEQPFTISALTAP